MKAMKNPKLKPATERQIQDTAELIFKWISGLPTPADAAAALAMAQCALMWQQQPRDEAHVREMLACTVEGIVEMWKSQVALKPDSATCQ